MRALEELALPPEVEPKEITRGMELTPVAEARLPQVIEAVLAEL